MIRQLIHAHRRLLPAHPLHRFHKPVREWIFVAVAHCDLKSAAVCTANVADLDVSDHPGLLFLRKAVEVVPRPRECILFSGKGDITKLDGALPFLCLL